MKLNLSAPINTLSYGIVSRNILKALAKLGVSVALWPIGQIEAPIEEHTLIRQCMDNARMYCKNAASVRIYHQFDLAQHVGSGKHIGFPIFELNRFKPHELVQLANQDDLIVCSHWARNVIEDTLGKRAHVAPLGVDSTFSREEMNWESHPDDVLPKAALDVIEWNKTTIFLNIGKFEVRKGHLELIRAFNRAFQPDDNVALILHCENPFLNDKQKNEWYCAAKNSKMGRRIFITNRFQTEQQVANLMSHAHCGVFLSKGEGWNMPLSEMMRMGKYCIATNVTAHTEFCDDTNSFLIDCPEMEPAHDGIWFKADDPNWNGKPGMWAKIGEQQIDEAADYMRVFHNNRTGINEWPYCPKAEEDMRVFTWEATAEAVINAAGC